MKEIFKPTVAACGVALIFAAGALAGCGGNSSKQEQLTVPEFRAKIVAICKQNSAGHEQIEKQIPKELMQVEPDDFTVAQAKQAAPFFDQTRAVTQKTADRIDALNPPDELKADTATALVHVISGLDHMHNTVSAMKSGDLKTMKSEQAAVKAEFDNPEMKRIGKTTGLAECDK